MVSLLPHSFIQARRKVKKSGREALARRDYLTVVLWTIVLDMATYGRGTIDGVVFTNGEVCVS